jgi:O-antigen/teichoic acid export membrane protein
MKFNKNLSSLIIIQWFQYIAAFVLMPHLISSLGISSYGYLVIAQAWAAFIAVIVEYGFSIIGVSELSKFKKNRKIVKNIFWSVIFCRLLIFIAIYSVIVLLYFLKQFDLNFGAIFCIVSFSAFGVALNAQWFFLGRQESHHIVKWSLLIKVVLLLSNFILITDESDILLAAVLYSLSSIIPAIYTFFSAIIEKKIGSPKNCFKYSVSFFLKATPFLIGRFANIGVNQVTIIASGLMFSSSNIAILSVSMKVIQVSTMIYAPLQQHLLAKMSDVFSLFILKKYILFCLIISVFQMLAIYLIAPYLSDFLLNRIDLVFIDILRYSSVTFPLSVFYMLIGAPVMIPLGENHKFNKSVFISFVIHVMIVSSFYVISGYSVEISLFIYSVFVFPISKFLALVLRGYYLRTIKGRMCTS